MAGLHSRRFFLKSGLAGLLSVCFPRCFSVGATLKKALPDVNLDFIASELELIPRDEWTDAVARTWLLREAGMYNRLTVHHAGVRINMHTIKNAVINDLQNLLAGHISKNYADIAYHLVIDYEGRIWEGRSLAYEGAHVSDNNERNIGVLVLGDFERQKPSVKQLDSLRILSGLLRDRYNIKKHRVYGHRDLSPSKCPGRYLYPHVLGMRAGPEKVFKKTPEKQRDKGGQDG